MAIRKSFPSSDQIIALPPVENEEMADIIRKQMFAQRSGVAMKGVRGYESREATSEEREILDKCEQYVDAFFSSIGQKNTPKITMERIQIFQRERGFIKSDSSSVHFGRVGFFSNIELRGIDKSSLTPARTFLHSAVHEFIHAKAQNRWKIGASTTRNISGFKSLVSGVENSTLIPKAAYFQGLNEAMTETIAILVCDDLFRSSWFQKFYGVQEKKTKEIRFAHCNHNNCDDAAIVEVAVGQSGETVPIIAYEYEQQALSLLFKQISERLNIPLPQVFLTFFTDYSEGTLKRIKPLLRKAFGPNMLRLLAVWRPTNKLEDAEGLFKLLLENYPRGQEYLIKQYIIAHGGVPKK